MIVPYREMPYGDLELLYSPSLPTVALRVANGSE